MFSSVLRIATTMPSVDMHGDILNLTGNFYSEYIFSVQMHALQNKGSGLQHKFVFLMKVSSVVHTAMP